MNELPPGASAPPATSPPQPRGLAPPYPHAVNAVNLAGMDRKSFHDARGPASLTPAKYQAQQQHALQQQANAFHVGGYAPATSYSQLKPQQGSRPVTKFDFPTPSQQQYSPHAQQQQQSYAAAYGYSPYAQSFGGTSDYQQQQQQQHYHGGYAPTGETNALGMLVSSATNPQAPPDAMPHDPVNIGLKDAADRKFRQSFGVLVSDSFLGSGGSGYTTSVHSVERPGNVVQLKTTPGGSQQQQAMYTRSGSNVYGGGTAYYSQQHQRTPQQSQHQQQQSPLELVPPNATLGANFDVLVNANGASVSSAISRGMNGGGGMFTAGGGSRMSQFSSAGASPSLTTRLKDGSVDISTSGGSNGANVAFMQQQPPTKALDTTHPSSLYADVASSASSMSMVSLASDGPATPAGNPNALYPPPQQLNTPGDEICNIPGHNVLSLSPSSVSSSKSSTMNSLHVTGSTPSGRPPPIDTHLGDGRVGPMTLSGGKRSSTSTRSGSSSGSGGRTRKNKKLKDCSVPGCDRTVRSRGLCKGHGGGRRCGFAGCGLSDQGGGFCISHGGGKRCQHDGCDNSAQSRGLCKLHGGGSRCTVPNCTKSSQGRGLCRAHGGGRRCMIEGCNKTDRRAGYCVTHGADKKCIVPECSKTGRIDNMCTKHYFERHPQPPGYVTASTPPPETTGTGNGAAKVRADRKKTASRAAGSYGGSSAMVQAPSVPTAGHSGSATVRFAGDRRTSEDVVKSQPF
ncbi:hypothetical protein BBJ28_00005912 [Nothophytophthora sp. Chile5]|nr:hypothetical protein BBJ28_00005912 [Nothophytophthora sp. Chile5]